MGYTVRFSVTVDHACCMERAARLAWRDIRMYAPMVDVTNDATGVSDSVDIGELSDADPD
ncbi:hypothetical protein JOD54_002162 [Actinokineospora baliensis]|uniref:hypothetical protein n=1 Tax=Actinokineospora baliensis TaxID=547056 RepID=UPI00195ED6EF|nr:hypothetical protein [Actinokineospora baliensis]MBM7771958.1 hypothetical protein [Actinokineospora baliensis]